MTEAQQTFIEMSKRYEALKEEMKALKLIMTESMIEIGVGKHFQDHVDNTVFQIVKPTGTFISFDDIGYERTRREGEAKGSMSMKRANELGYNVK